METPKFFETDPDEVVFADTKFVDYFNLYPNLWFQATLGHLQRLDGVAVLDFKETQEGWKIAVRIADYRFLLDTHYHGTSTRFCVEKGVVDTMAMLAFLGCFLPAVRDDWQPPVK